MSDQYGQDPYLDGMFVRLGSLYLKGTEKELTKEESDEFIELQKLIKEYRDV